MAKITCPKCGHEVEKQADTSAERQKRYRENQAVTLRNALRNVTKRNANFAAPTLAEVSDYCASRGNAVDAGAFVDFYASKGWIVGRSPMKDWRAAVRTWEKNSRPSSNGQHSGLKSFAEKDLYES